MENRISVIRLIMALAIFGVLSFALFGMVATAEAKVKYYGPVQASYYVISSSSSKTASGMTMTWETMGVAVPMETVVSKKTWKKSSKKFKRTHFYYGENLKIKHGKHICKVTVMDCGGFGSYGCYYKGKWRNRLFDLQPAARKALHIVDGVGLVKWRIIK